MFKVKWRESWEDVTVYDVRYDSNGYPQFLIYSKDTRECWCQQNIFCPEGNF